jgi:hypothetical protein
MVRHAKSIEDQVNGLWATVFKGSKAQEEGQMLYHVRMAESIKDQRLLDSFTPELGIGCRRVTPGDPYMTYAFSHIPIWLPWFLYAICLPTPSLNCRAMQKPNVDVHFTTIDKRTENGVVGGHGIERECGTIVRATGFDVSSRPRFPIIGRDGVDLVKNWEIIYARQCVRMLLTEQSSRSA